MNYWRNKIQKYIFNYVIEAPNGVILLIFLKDNPNIKDILLILP